MTSRLRRLLRRALVLPVAVAAALAGAMLAPASAATYSTHAQSLWYPSDGIVYAMARSGNTIYLGGTFTHLRNATTGATVARSHLAAVDATSGAVLGVWNPAANNTVRAIAVGPSGIIYVGGDFTRMGDGVATRLAAITAAGDPVAGWDASAGDTVRDITATPAGLFVAGRFGVVDGVSRIGVARLDPGTGDLVKTFNAKVGGGRVWAITPAPDGQSLLLGGSFSTLGGTARSFSGAVTVAAGAVTSWAPASLCDNCEVLDLTVADGSVYAAVGGEPGGWTASWSLSTGGLLFAKHADGDVQTVAVFDGVLYAGGHFGPVFDGATRHQLAALDATTGATLSYALPIVGADHPGIWAILADSSTLRIAGGFHLGDSPVARYAVFRTP